jgi:hypothetical protein
VDTRQVLSNAGALMFSINWSRFLPRSQFQSRRLESINIFLNSVDFVELFHADLPAQCIIEKFYGINACIDGFVPLRSCKLSGKSRAINYPYSVRRKLRKKVKRGEFTAPLARQSLL